MVVLAVVLLAVDGGGSISDSDGAMVVVAM